MARSSSSTTTVRRSCRPRARRTSPARSSRSTSAVVPAEFSPSTVPSRPALSSCRARRASMKRDQGAYVRRVHAVALREPGAVQPQLDGGRAQRWTISSSGPWAGSEEVDTRPLPAIISLGEYLAQRDNRGRCHDRTRQRRVPGCVRQGPGESGRPTARRSRSPPPSARPGSTPAARADAPPLLLLPGGGGATSASWYAQAAALARIRRVLAVDLPGAPGLSRAGDRHPPVRSPTWPAGWTPSWPASASPRPTSAGTPRRVDRPAPRAARCPPGCAACYSSLDPDAVLRPGFKAAYLLAPCRCCCGPRPAGSAPFLEWETGGQRLDPDWLRLQEAAAGLPIRAAPVTSPAPGAKALRALPGARCLPRGPANGGTRDPQEVREAGAGALLPH